MNLSCLKHPKYNGMETPNLLCKVCCSIYVQAIKTEATKELVRLSHASQKQDSFRAAEWLLKKGLEASKLPGAID